MAVLHRVRNRTPELSRAVETRAHAVLRRLRTSLFVAAISWMGTAACGDRNSDLPPDGRLQRELGLEPSDRVHTVRLHGGMDGWLEPAEALVRPGDYLQFVNADSWIHEITFDADSLSGSALGFMQGFDQLASPPLVSRGSRFVVSFVDAPTGRYAYLVLGNGAPKRGAVVVAEPEPR